MCVSPFLCHDDIRLEKCGNSSKGLLINVNERIIFRKSINRNIECISMPIFDTTFVNMSCSRKQIASCFVYGKRTYIGIIVEGPLNTIHVMCICIIIQDFFLLFFFYIFFVYDFIILYAILCFFTLLFVIV